MEEIKTFAKFCKFDVVYADLGRQLEGVEGGLRPVVIVSCDKSNHMRAPQVTVVPLTKRLKNIPVHVVIKPGDVVGYKLRFDSDFIPEDIQTISKVNFCSKSGHIREDSPIREKLDRALIRQLDLMPTARKIIEEENDNALSA